MSVSQPSVRLSLLQSPKPTLHVPLHTPPAHDAAMLFAEQPWLQPPQFAVLVEMLVSHPSASLFELQSAYPWAQAPLQTFPEHVGVGTLLFEHAFGQPPQ